MRWSIGTLVRWLQREAAIERMIRDVQRILPEIDPIEIEQYIRRTSDMGDQS